MTAAGSVVTAAVSAVTAAGSAVTAAGSVVTAAGSVVTAAGGLNFGLSGHLCDVRRLCVLLPHTQQSDFALIFFVFINGINTVFM